MPQRSELGYRVTAKDIDAEKEALWQHLNSALWGGMEAIRGFGVPEPLRSSPLPAARTAPITIPSTPSSTSLPVTSAGDASPSDGTSGGSAPQPTSDSEVTLHLPMYFPWDLA